MARLTGIGWLLLIAIAFGANHVAARLAFDHGVSIPTAVAVRSLATALLVLGLIRHAGVPLALPRTTVLRGLLIGALVALQSLCLAAAVARMPVALALLVFNTFPMVLAVLSWLTGGERPRRRTWVAMALALLGLSLALFYAGAISSLFIVLPRLGAVNNAAVLNVEPIAALGLGWLALGQSMVPAQLAGAAVVIGAIVMLSTGQPRR